jgi:hypothetical protein
MLAPEGNYHLGLPVHRSDHHQVLLRELAAWSAGLYIAGQGAHYAWQPVVAGYCELVPKLSRGML